MALVIDASTPASSAVTTQTNTTASFTPPDNSFLLGLWAANSTLSTDPATPTVSDTGMATWSTPVWDHQTSGVPTVDGQAAIFDATLVGPSPGPITVSVVNGAAANYHSVLNLMVLTGHDPAGPVGISGGGRRQAGTSLTVSFNASITGGQGFLSLCDWNAEVTTAWAADTGCTMLAKGTIAGQISYAVIQRTSPDEVVGAPTSLGITGFGGGGDYHWAYAEVISLEAAIAAAAQAGYPAFGANAPMF